MSEAEVEEDDLRPEHDPGALTGCVRVRPIQRCRAETNLALPAPGSTRCS